MLARSRNILFLLLILTGHYSLLLAYCPPKSKLISDYQAIVRGNKYPKYVALQTIVKQWESCQYAQDSNFVDLLSAVAKDASYYRMDTLAMETAQRALYLAKKSGPGSGKNDLPKALFRIGKLFFLLSDKKQATAFLQNTIAISNSYQRLHWASLAATELAFIAYNNGDHETSLNWSEKGIRWANQINDKEALLRNQFAQVRVLIDVDKKKEALTLLGAIIERGYTVPNLYLDVPLYYLTYGNILKSEGKLSEAEPYLLKSLTLVQLLKNPEQIASSELNIGFFYYDLKKYDKALYYYNQSLQKAKDFNRKARLYDNIGAVYWMQKKYQTAIRYYQKGLVSLKTNLNDTLNLAANPSAESIRSLANKEFLLTLIQDKADTWLDYAKVTHNRQRFQYALDTYQVADQMIDIMRWEHTGQQSKLYWRQKTRGMYERAIATCFLLGNAEQGFRFLEKSRAVMLADKLNELGARQSLSLQQLKQEEQLKQALSLQQSKLADLNPDESDSYNSARMALFAKQDSLAEFLKQIESSNPVYYRYKYDTTITSLTDLKGYLKIQKASFVTYFVGDSTLYVLGVTPDGAKLYSQPLNAYRQDVQVFMKLLWSSDAMSRKVNFTQFLALGNGLYNQLLAPLQLPTGRVIVSPDGASLPFETLSRKINEPDYLVKDYAFSYIYSVRSLLKKQDKNQTRTTSRHPDFLGIAPVTFASSLNQVTLPGSEESLKRIAERFHSPELLANRSATRRSFLTKATEATVIHLFTHATADSSGQDPILYFADSTLKLSDLGDGILPNAELVTLAACKTGVGAVQQGEGVFSFARGFAALGVPSVLTTLWSVQDNATYKLTELFYKHLDEGQPKDIALQYAKRDWLEAASQTDQLPNFWAGMIIIGDTIPLSRTTKGMWTAIIPLMAFGVWAWQKQRHKLT